MIPTRDELAPLMDELEPAHHVYVNTVSHAAWAASTELAAFIEWVCVRNDPTTVCDLGSGFTSYVLRKYATGRGVACTSVDTDGDWLAKTEAFLYAHDLDLTDCVPWVDWKDRSDLYDLIVVDMANGQLRDDAIRASALRLNPGGVVIFDDANSADHWPTMSTVASDHGLRFAIACDLKDNLGRFPAVAW